MIMLMISYMISYYYIPGVRSAQAPPLPSARPGGSPDGIGCMMPASTSSGRRSPTATASLTVLTGTTTVGCTGMSRTRFCSHNTIKCKGGPARVLATRPVRGWQMGHRGRENPTTRQMLPGMNLDILVHTKYRRSGQHAQRSL